MLPSRPSRTTPGWVIVQMTVSHGSPMLSPDLDTPKYSYLGRHLSARNKARKTGESIRNLVERAVGWRGRVPLLGDGCPILGRVINAVVAFTSISAEGGGRTTSSRTIRPPPFAGIGVGVVCVRPAQKRARHRAGVAAPDNPTCPRRRRGLSLKYLRTRGHATRRWCATRQRPGATSRRSFQPFP